MTSHIENFIKAGVQAFAPYPKPAQCIDYLGDPEYTEYEESLRGVSCENLKMTHIGHTGWGPLLALGPEALAYYMPKLVEFAVDGEKDKTDYPFMFRLVNLLEQGPTSKRFIILGFEQREFIFRALLILKGLYYKQYQDWHSEQELDTAIELWKI
jgi:hypothetical protein